MSNLNVLETLHTKEELINYFKAMGKNIFEEEIQTLKNYYEKIEKNDNFLNLQQLDRASGGAGGIFEPIKRFFSRKSSTDIEMHPLAVGKDRPNAGAQNYFDYSKFLGCNNHTKELTEVTDPNLKEKCLDLYNQTNIPESPDSGITPEKAMACFFVAACLVGSISQVTQALSDTSKNKSNK